MATPSFGRPMVPKGTASEFLGCLQNLFGVARDLRLFPDANDPAIGADQIGVAEDAHVAAAPHGFFGPDAIGLQHLVRFVRRQRSEEHTSELQSRQYLVCRLLL